MAQQKPAVDQASSTGREGYRSDIVPDKVEAVFRARMCQRQEGFGAVHAHHAAWAKHLSDEMCGAPRTAPQVQGEIEGSLGEVREERAARRGEEPRYRGEPGRGKVGVTEGILTAHLCVPVCHGANCRCGAAGSQPGA